MQCQVVGVPVDNDFCDYAVDRRRPGPVDFRRLQRIPDAGGRQRGFRFACAGRPARSRWCKSTAMKE